MVSTVVDACDLSQKKQTVLQHPWVSSDFKNFQSYWRFLRRLIQAYPALDAHYAAWHGEDRPTCRGAIVKPQTRSSLTETAPSSVLDQEQFDEFAAADARL